MNKLETLNFKKDFVLPIEEQDRQLGFIKWGRKNDYPYFLIDLYNGSAWHQGIIKNKTYYIAGGGIETVSGNATKFLANAYSEFSMDEIVEQLAFDYELFGAFAVKGTWNREGTRVVLYEYIAIDMLRLSPDERIFYLSDDWLAQQQSVEKTNLRTIPGLDLENKSGSFILYYKDPSKKGRKEQGTYSKPPYQGGITAIQTDCDISKFNMYEIQNSFKSGTMITFMNGFPETQEEADAFKRQIKEPASNIENSGDIIITFAPSADQAPKVDNLNGNDLDKRYTQLQAAVQQNILVSHSVVSPSLFGVAPAGSFNAAETEELYYIFQNTYVNTRQKRIEWVLNYMLELSGEVGQLKLADTNPIGSKVQEAVAQTPVEQTPIGEIPTNEIQVDVAKSALNGAQIASLIEVAAQIKSGILTQDAALNIILSSFPSINEAQARKIVGLPSQGNTFSSCKHNFSDNEIDIYSQFGEDASNYTVLASYPIAWDTSNEEVNGKHDQIFATIGEISAELNDFDKSVLKLLNDGEESSSIAKALKSSIKEIAQSIAKMITYDLYVKGQVSDLGNRLLNESDPGIDRFEVRYTYRTRTDVPAAKSGSREFCEKLLQLNRLYSRDDINTISNRVDRNVWNYRGGWYTNPDTQVSTPFCRHEWIQQLVIKNN
jgi:hypothetical protein